MPMKRVTIVGGSLAGLRAAQELRAEGFDGAIRIVAGEGHLPVDRPPMSKQILAGTWEPDRAVLRGTDDIAAEWILGRSATALDAGTHRVTLDDATTIDGDGVVIATGAIPRRLPTHIVPPEMAGVHELRTLADCLAIRADFDRGGRIVVIGAGFIGGEVAATAKALDLEVTVLEALAIPLERALGSEMGKLCGQLHLDHGVDLRCDSGVERLVTDGSGRVASVALTDGTFVECDVVVVGVGVLPATSWLDGSGLTLGDGVVCDDRCRAAPGVVAAGDVARWYHQGLGTEIRVEHWTNAAEQGAAAARTLLHGDAAPAYRPIPYFWSDQHKTKIQFVGHRRSGDAVEVVEGSPDEGKFVAVYATNGRISGALLWNRPSRVAYWSDMVAQSLSPS
ncbi:MAG: FAD-dependent oxidoreductase [Acidimicrobiales bacterium]